MTDLERFEIAYRTWFDFAWSTLRWSGIHGDDLEDALQEVFVVLHRRWQAIDGDPRHQRAWIRGICRRVASHYHRSHKRKQRLYEAISIVQTSSEVERLDYDADRECADVVHRFLAELDEDRREAFIAMDLLELTGREAAALLSVNANTLATRVRRARVLFRQFVTKHWQTQEGLEQLQPQALLARAREPGPGHTRVRQRVYCLVYPLFVGELSEPASETLASGAGGTGLSRLPGGASSLFGGVGVVMTGAIAVVALGLGSTQLPPAVVVPDGARLEARSASVGTETSVVAEPPVARTPVVPLEADPKLAGRPARRTRGEASKARATRRAYPNQGVELLVEARRALRGGHAGKALRLIRTHRRRYPSSGLVDVRVKLEVEIYCQNGQLNQAERAARALSDQALAQRWLRACRSEKVGAT